MFLKGLKEKSNQKFVNRTLQNRKVLSSNKPIKSVGVILNESEFVDYELFSSFLESLGVASTKQKIVTFLKTKDFEKNTWDETFTPKDFGWKGNLKNASLKDFTEIKFDVLICYYLANDNELNQIAAMSEANFKVGISNEDRRLYDLIIDVDTKDFSIFKTELKKYLTILNKL